MRTATPIGLVLALALSVTATACGSGGTSYGGGSAAPAPVSCSGATPVALTVKNYLSWCDVSVAGRAASTAAAQTVCVAAGAVPLSATPSAGFELGPAPWHDTDDDHGAGDPADATTVTVSGASDCAWVCCPFPDGTGCPTTDQCP